MDPESVKDSQKETESSQGHADASANETASSEQLAQGPMSSRIQAHPEPIDSKNLNFHSKNIHRKSDINYFLRIKNATLNKYKQILANHEQRLRAKYEASSKKLSMDFEEFKRQNLRGRGKTTAIVALVILVLAFVGVPLGTKLYNKHVQRVAEREKQAEEEEMREYVSSDSYQIGVIVSDAQKLMHEGNLAGGCEIFDHAIESNKNQRDRLVELYYEYGRNLMVEFGHDQLDKAIEMALKADEIEQSSRTADLLVQIYREKNDNEKLAEYEKLYSDRLASEHYAGADEHYMEGEG